MNRTSIVPNDAVRNTPTTGNRVYCLYRVSTNQQVDHDEKDEADIPMQRVECHKFADRMGWWHRQILQTRIVIYMQNAEV